MHTPIALELESFWDRRRAQEERDRCENARRAFKGIWLRGTEIELHECQEKLHVVQDQFILRNLEAYREILCDKLKTHHTNLGILNTKEAVGERRGVCVNTRPAKCRGPASRELSGRASPCKERWASPNKKPTAAMQQR